LQVARKIAPCNMALRLSDVPIAKNWPSDEDNRPFPWVKFWSRQVWTKISSQLERASQN
jgi:hypothetical protein